MAEGVVRVAVADGDALVRAGIVALLAYHPDLEVVLAAPSGGDLVRGLVGRTVDAVLVAVRMPGLDGFATIEELRRAGIEAPVALLATFRQEALVDRAIAAGARGFLLRSDDPGDLARSVRALAAGGAVFSPRIATWLVRSGAVERLREQETARRRVASLTDRQRDVLARLALGDSNTQIARALGLSEGTVKQYLREVFERLGVENRVQAALLGYQAGLDARSRPVGDGDD